MEVRELKKNMEQYPARLRRCENAPESLFVKGIVPYDDLKTAAVIGARICSEYGRYMARTIGTQLAAEGYQLISGMSLGVDGIAARGAMSQDGRVFIVPGCGADIIYPEENGMIYDYARKNGGIISLFQEGTKPEASLFPRRSELIAQLADTIILVEARRKSAALFTAEYAKSIGKRVIVLPGRLTDRLSDGCNDLLRKGYEMYYDVYSLIA